MRRSIDDLPLNELPPGVEDDSPVSWAVAICDDYEDANPRIVLTVEEIGKAGAGLVAHLDPAQARRLSKALRDGLVEIGEKTH